MKKTTQLLGIALLLAVMVLQNALPVSAATPGFDITGVWKTSSGEVAQVFQENDEVNGIFVNAGFAHRWSGRYVSRNKIHVVQIRRTRPNSCEMTGTIDITVNSANSITVTGVAAETACGLTSGPGGTETLTRVL